MGESMRAKRIVALLAAYIVALGTLVLPLSLVSGQPAGFSLCAVATSADVPAGDRSGCPCAGGCGMLCCASSVFATPPQIGVGRFAVQFRAMVPRFYEAPVVRPADEVPSVPRPPPFAV